MILTATCFCKNIILIKSLLEKSRIITKKIILGGGCRLPAHVIYIIVYMKVYCKIHVITEIAVHLCHYVMNKEHNERMHL